MVRAKIIKLLEENIEKHNCKLDLGNNFLDLTQKVQASKIKMDTLDFMKIKTFCISKDSIK